MESRNGLDLSVVERIVRALKKGVFLTTSGQRDNAMIIGWGSYGTMWGQDVFMAPVRYSRFTHEQLSVGSAFTLSVPGEGMGEAVKICGSRSGRDMDKFAACSMEKLAARQVDVPVIGGCKYHMECRVLSVAKMQPEALAGDEYARWYSMEHSGAGNQDDFHDLYFAKILEAYEG